MLAPSPVSISPDQAQAALGYGRVAKNGVAAIIKAAKAVSNKCAVGADLEECKTALYTLEATAQRVDGELTKVYVPPAMQGVDQELRTSLELFQRAAQTDLKGREAQDIAPLNEATSLTERGMAGFERATTMLQRLLGMH